MARVGLDVTPGELANKTRVGEGTVDVGGTSSPRVRVRDTLGLFISTESHRVYTEHTIDVQDGIGPGTIPGVETTSSPEMDPRGRTRHTGRVVGRGTDL